MSVTVTTQVFIVHEFECHLFGGWCLTNGTFFQAVSLIDRSNGTGRLSGMGSCAVWEARGSDAQL